MAGRPIRRARLAAVTASEASASTGTMRALKLKHPCRGCRPTSERKHVKCQYVGRVLTVECSHTRSLAGESAREAMGILASIATFPTGTPKQAPKHTEASVAKQLRSLRTQMDVLLRTGAQA